jgi:RNA polymerase sigma-70 factor (ECF subfamily)
MKCNATNFIIRLKKHNEDALEYIIEQYASLVHAISCKILNNISNETIDECVNDVFYQFGGKMQISLRVNLKILKNGLQR